MSRIGNDQIQTIPKSTIHCRSDAVTHFSKFAEESNSSTSGMIWGWVFRNTQQDNLESKSSLTSHFSIRDWILAPKLRKRATARHLHNPAAAGRCVWRGFAVWCESLSNMNIRFTVRRLTAASLQWNTTWLIMDSSLSLALVRVLSRALGRYFWVRGGYGSHTQTHTNEKQPDSLRLSYKHVWKHRLRLAV